MVATAVGERLDLPVTVVASLAEAREALAETDRYFLVLTGLVLADAEPGAILDFFAAAGVPTVVVSGNYDQATREEILARPVVDCVLKNTPGNIDYLVWLAQRLDRNRRIGALVVDDSPSARKLAASLLRMYGFRVVEAGTGEEALRAIAADTSVRLLISDYELPGIDGLELIRRLRATHARDRLSIIGISGSGSPSLLAQFLKHGANDFLHKPYSREEFFCRVSQNVDNLDLIGTLQDLATRDFLTGLPNRRHFFDRGMQMFEAERCGLAAGMIDIDHFKHINDSYGHDAGDVAIKAVADRVARHARVQDLPSRFGGEEFAVLVPGLSGDAARAHFERLRADVEAMAIPLGDGRSIRLTISIGVCTTGGDLSAMLAEADRRLYLAKAGGRNRVEPRAGVLTAVA
ncbi:diguanylate cyclase [Luteimonas sp. SJ-92]|uniref:diguanylate cyclase n=2 Tax=Luteimonas salinisoli TaxID=2752307 RepID=A0A853JI80_9GAMM|nr:diguanylate cyclase [Luteimonas salinisoli]NZA28247.1 diguanylate cyclase [Luteimonas salinisoli]